MNFSNICIDFGTCNTVISYYDNQTQKILQITNDYDGNILIPSSLYIDYDKLTSDVEIDKMIYLIDYNIGDNFNIINNQCYFYQFKRFLGITSNTYDKYILI